MKVKTAKVSPALVGALTGFVNGFFGGGGGMLCVPLMVNALQFSQKQAHATAIFFILPLSVVSGICYAVLGCFPITGWWVALGVTLGGATGAVLLCKLSEKGTSKIFSVVMGVSGLYLLLF